MKSFLNEHFFLLFNRVLTTRCFFNFHFISKGMFTQFSEVLKMSLFTIDFEFIGKTLPALKTN